MFSSDNTLHNSQEVDFEEQLMDLHKEIRRLRAETSASTSFFSSVAETLTPMHCFDRTLPPIQHKTISKFEKPEERRSIAKQQKQQRRQQRVNSILQAKMTEMSQFVPEFDASVAEQLKTYTLQVRSTQEAKVQKLLEEHIKVDVQNEMGKMFPRAMYNELVRIQICKDLDSFREKVVREANSPVANAKSTPKFPESAMQTSQIDTEGPEKCDNNIQTETVTVQSPLWDMVDSAAQQEYSYQQDFQTVNAALSPIQEKPSQAENGDFLNYKSTTEEYSSPLGGDYLDDGLMAGGDLLYAKDRSYYMDDQIYGYLDPDTFMF